MKKADVFEMMLMAAGILIPLVYMKARLGPFTITIVEIMTMLLILTFIIRVIKNNIILTVTTVDILFLFLVYWAVISVPKSIDISKTWSEIMLLFECGLIFNMVRQSIKEEAAFRRVIKFWCYGCSIVAALGIMQYILLVKSGIAFLGNDHGYLSVALRIHSTIPHANSLSGYLIIFIPIMFAFIYESQNNDRIFWGLLTVFTVSALIFTYTRAGWFASVISVFLLVYLLGDKRLLIVFPISVAVLCMALPNVITRVGSLLSLDSDLGSLQRVQLWEAALLMWRDKPLTGTGAGNYFHLLMQYAGKYPHLSQIFQPIEPHSSFIKFLAETGTPGFIMFVSLIFILSKQVVAAYLSRRCCTQRVIFSGIISGGLAFLLQSNTNSLFHEPRVAVIFWMVAGLAYGTLVKQKHEEATSGELTQNRLIICQKPTRTEG